MIPHCGMHSVTRESVLGNTGLLFLVLSNQKLDIDFHAVDANKFAAAISEAGRRQQQEELFEIETLNGPLDGQHRIGIGYRIEHAVPAPRSVDAHDADAVAAAEGYPLLPFVLVCHV